MKIVHFIYILVYWYDYWKHNFFRAAVTCMGFMYKNLGRMMGRSYEETVYILIKCLKNAESQMRVEIIITLEKVPNCFY